MYKNVIFVLLLVVISGCASPKNIPIAENAITENETHSVIVTKREKPSFSAMTPGKGAFGLIGAVAMISAGNELIKENKVEDPAQYIGTKLVDALQTKYKLFLIEDNNEIIDSTDVEKIAETYKSANYALDVQTVNWSFTYFPTDWSHYRVIYSAKMKLIDTKMNKIVAEGFCSRVPEKDENAPTYDDLTQNNAAGLKKELMTAADFCVDYFNKEIFKLTVNSSINQTENTSEQN